MASGDLGLGSVSSGVRAGTLPPPPADSPDAVASRGGFKDLLSFAAAHPEQRNRLETALIANGRLSDFFALNQANPSARGEAASKARKPDYDTPFWTTTPDGSGPTYRLRPASDPAYKVATAPAWDPLVQAGTVSASEQRVVSRMSDNEGRLDSVQAWDDQIVTAGAMQKTVNPSSTGELAQQVYAFSQSDPDAYKTLFSDRGWTAAKPGADTTAADYTMAFTADGTKLTGKALADYIKDPKQPEQWKAALDPLLQAGRDPAFQTKQIKDYVARLDTAVGTVPRSAVKGVRYDHPISDYVTSEQGAALVLDESVNRPAHVRTTFGKALDSFYAANPKTSKDPTSWTAEQRAAYEPQIVKTYVAQRNRTNMTDPAQRAAHITGAGTPLSADPGSFQRVQR